MTTPTRRFVRLNVDDPAVLKRLTEAGAIWQTPYVARAVDAIMCGDILLADCRDVPHRLVVFMRASLDRRLPPT